MQIESYGLSDVGKKRDKNEDRYLTLSDLDLYMVADGMGGHVGGEYASRLATDTVKEIAAALAKDPEATLPETGEFKPGDYKGYLQYALSTASLRIYEEATIDKRLQGMGTTAVILWFQSNKVAIANVGDSRAYRIRNGKIEQLTTDHSLVSEQIRAGVLQPSEARDHRLKNIITRSVGFQEEVEADIETKMVKTGDIYLLCTDGLYNLVEDEEMLDVILHQNLKHACKHLVDIANARGGDDNITVILTQVASLAPEAEEESTMEA